jgi:hypothetical protein
MNIEPSGFEPDPGEIPKPTDTEELVPSPFSSRLGAGEEVPGKVPASSETILA